MKKIFFLVTIDGDLRIGSTEQQKSGVQAIRRVHRDLNIIGSTTWMINEIDFKWTQDHGELLLELFDSGECIGVHDHLDTHYAETYDQILEIMRLSRDRIAEFFKSHQKSVDLLAHRNGCAFQTEISYQAAQALRYRILSDVWPEMIWHGRMVRVEEQPNAWKRLSENNPETICMDNRMVPLHGRPWRHNPDNWLDHESREGWFLHVPINSMPTLDRDRVKEAVGNTDGNAYIVIDTHPYDLQDPKSGEVSDLLVGNYSESLAWMIEEYSAECVQLDQVIELNH
jgi:hypothetical protein